MSLALRIKIEKEIEERKQGKESENTMKIKWIEKLIEPYLKKI